MPVWRMQYFHIKSPFWTFNNASALLTTRCTSHLCATSSSAHLSHPPETFISVGDCTPTETSLFLHSPLIEVGVFSNWDKNAILFFYFIRLYNLTTKTLKSTINIIYTIFPMQNICKYTRMQKMFHVKHFIANQVFPFIIFIELLFL